LIVLSNEHNINLKLKGEVQELNLKLREKDELIRLLRARLDEKEKGIRKLEDEIEEWKKTEEKLKIDISNLRSTLDIFNIEGVLEESDRRSLHKNKLAIALKEKKVAQKVVSFLVPSEILELSLASKIIKSEICHSPGFLMSVSRSTMYDKHNIKYTAVLEHVNELKKITLKNKPSIVTGIKRYLYYNYDITEMIEGVVATSIKNIENIKMNYHDTMKEEKPKQDGKLMGMFKTIMKVPKKDKNAGLKFTKIRKVPLKMMEVIDKLQSKTPFKKMMLLSLNNKDKINVMDPAEFRKNQNKIYRKETEMKATAFIVEFNNLIMNIGDSADGLRDLAFFLVKEVSKGYVYLQTVLKEYHLLHYIKDYLYGEMMAQHLQVALLKNDLAESKGGAWMVDMKELQTQIMQFDRENMNLQKENNKLKMNVIDLNESIQVSGG
jgi:cell division protein FtsB